MREVNPNNCEKTELDQFCRNIVFYIPLKTGFLPGCGGNKIIDFPLSKAMGGWRNFSKFDRMIDMVNQIYYRAN